MNGSRLGFEYRSLQPRGDMVRIAREAEQVFQAIKHEAERRGVVRVLILPAFSKVMEYEGRKEPTVITTPMAYDRRSDGSWQDHSSQLRGLKEPQGVRAGRALDEGDFQKIWHAVSAIPNPVRLAGISPYVCSEGNDGFNATRLTLHYEERLFWSGDRQRFENVVRTLQEEAERAAVREAVVAVRDGDRHAWYKFSRYQTGAWSDPVQILP